MSLDSKQIISGLTLETRVARIEGIADCSLGTETVILQIESGVYFGLDEVGSRIWELLEQPKQVSEIVTGILETFEVSESECADDLLDLLQEMQNNALIRVQPQQGAFAE